MFSGASPAPNHLAIAPMPPMPPMPPIRLLRPALSWRLLLATRVRVWHIRRVMCGWLPIKLACAGLWLCIFVAPASRGEGEPAAAVKPPCVWIFNGTPGDEEHHAFYEKNLARLRGAFLERLSVPPENLTVLYGPKSEGYDGVCTRENLLAEIARGVNLAAADQPVWMIFEGHSNPTDAGANFNLPGPDVTSRDLRDAFAKTKPDAQLVIIFTTSSSGRFMRWIAGPGRLVVTATLEDEEDNETEFPHVLADVLENPATDADHDGRLTLLEIFNACNAGVKAVYDQGKFIQRERAMLDGNGDRRGTQRPAREDAEPASRVAFPIAGAARKKFD
jgi:hypothetical protein